MMGEFSNEEKKSKKIKIGDILGKIERDSKN
jgi:hypothetical protein